MRLDRPATVPDLEPEYRAYTGEALEPFLEAHRVTQKRVIECIEKGVATRDKEGTRLARRLLRFSNCQRERLRLALGAPRRRR